MDIDHIINVIKRVQSVVAYPPTLQLFNSEDTKQVRRIR